MPIQKITKIVSYKERVCDVLKRAITRNELKGGEMINERALSEQFGISRTPIREALKSLESEGWIESSPFRGTWVKQIDPEDIREIYQMRLALEPLAAELAIRQATDRERRKLMQLAAQQVADTGLSDTIRFTQADMEFHLYLARLSGNAILLKTLSGFMDLMSWYLVQTIRRVQPCSVPMQEHEAIAAAVCRGDVSAARRASEEHIRRGYETAVQNIKQTKEG